MCPVMKAGNSKVNTDIEGDYNNLFMVVKIIVLVIVRNYKVTKQTDGIRVVEEDFMCGLMALGINIIRKYVVIGVQNHHMLKLYVDQGPLRYKKCDALVTKPNSVIYSDRIRTMKKRSDIIIQEAQIMIKMWAMRI